MCESKRFATNQEEEVLQSEARWPLRREEVAGIVRGT